MVPPVRSHSRRLSTAVSVAELIVRCGGVPVVAGLPGDCVGPPVSVGSLLRREGRGPHSVDRPLLPRGYDRPPAAPPRRNARKAAAAAGAMFAVGAVLGPSVLHDASLPRADAGPSQSLASLPGAAVVGNGATVRSIAASGADVLPAGGMALAAAVKDMPLTAGGSAAGGSAAGGRAGLLPSMLRPGGFATVPAAAPAGAQPAPGTPGAATPGGPGVPGAPATPGSPADPGSPGSPAVPGDPGAPGSPGSPGSPTEPPSIPPPVVAMPPAGPAITLPLPDARTPPVTVPGTSIDGVVRTPSIGVSAAAALGPQVTLAVNAEGAAVATSPAAVITPNVAVGSAKVGPVATSEGAVVLPDVAIGSAGVSVTKTGGVQAVLPSVEVSQTEVVTPDVTVGDTTVALPDVTLPEVALPQVGLAPQDLPETVEKVGKATVDTVQNVGDAAGATLGSVGSTVTGLLGGH
ncbi:hypothetical protein [Pseudonocardia sp. GCM10023141]|uniref:hypothetical protein n=1 Tax=Pseudonocardia sp. GCM10023141 TaxID=3252653 RepID=UPI00361A9D07